MQDSDFDSCKSIGSHLQNSDTYSNTDQSMAEGEQEQTYQERLLEYIAQTHATLRSYTEIDGLLKAIALALSALPGFCSKKFYVSAEPDFNLVRVETDNEQEDHSSLQIVPLPMSIVSELMSDNYYLSQVYCIPASSPLYKHDCVKQLFQTATHTNDRLSVVQDNSLEELIIVPLSSDTGELSGLFIFTGGQHQQTHATETFLSLVLFASQVAILMERAHLYTEIHKMSKERIEAERLKNRFLMTVAHELRTPLTAVQGYLDLLENFGKTLPEQQKERFISKASRACEELVLLLDNVMDASRIDQDKVELKIVSLHAIETIRTTVEILDAIITKEQRSIEIHMPEHLFVWGDELRLRQILLNLVSNALKYTPASTKIEIRARQMTYHEACKQFASFGQARNLSEQKEYVIIAVQDWGPGVAIEDQGRLFAKFMRLNGALNSTQRGAGLGLYFCRQLTEAMEGHIWMESTDASGQGATFMVALPRVC